MPIVHFLQNQGVDFRLRTKVTDIIVNSDCGTETVSAIRVLHDSSQETITIHPDDIVIVSLGSVTSGASSGTNKSPPFLDTIVPENELDENWSLWLNLGTKHPRFGGPYNFCTRVTESRLETFTVTLKDAEFFKRFVKLTCDKPGVGSLVSLKDSNWKINVCIPRQPFFAGQPDDVQTFWGYGLCPDREGNFVKKKMLFCSGEEIMTELLWHLGFPPESILNNCITIPCVMPRRTASLLPRTLGDRPPVIPEKMTNLALVGQFVEIPDETTASMDYGVRGAQLAVSRLMDIQKEPERTRKRSILSFLGLLV
jgi:oleate hydratase